jgi:hypothetical protein
MVDTTGLWQPAHGEAAASSQHKDVSGDCSAAVDVREQCRDQPLDSGDLARPRILVRNQPDPGMSRRISSDGGEICAVRGDHQSLFGKRARKDPLIRTPGRKQPIVPKLWERLCTSDGVKQASIRRRRRGWRLILRR